MTEDQSPHQSIPLLKSNEEQLAKIGRQLEGIFREPQLVQDVIMICCRVRESVSSDLDDEVEYVLRRCGSERVFGVLKTLTEIVERFGGSAECLKRAGTNISETIERLPVQTAMMAPGTSAPHRTKSLLRRCRTQWGMRCIG